MSGRIDRPGVYSISAEQYHGDPCIEPSLSSSIAWSLVEESPLHAWAKHPRFGETENRRSRAMDLGQAIHALLLEGEDRMARIEADSFRTKDAKEQRDAAYAAGKIPMLAEQADEALNAVHWAKQELAKHQDSAGVFDNGKPEQALIWQEGGIWCRALLDWLPASGFIFTDLKTTGGSANPESWIKSHLFADGYDMQAAFYCRGIRALGLAKRPVFRFVVLETKPPYALSVIAMGEEAMQYGDRRVQTALDLWRRCLTTGKWPGYEPRTAWAELPIYLARQQEERQAREEMNRPAEEYMNA